ncbi:OrfL2 protein [Geomicrobium sp. JCM 19038]|nr:DUF2243 domain-containing protein [Geomicrobium sp. JCM 19038]GAK09836.1 OrfL2 protein [Geomicrobium sp. JCM 19038]
MTQTSATYNLWSGLLFGLGMVAFIDEVLFHQLLHWHHFYDKSTTDVGLVSDGLFHAFSWFSTIASLFMLAGLRKNHNFWLKRWLGGVFLGAGVFQLYDGVVQHKLMKIHQIRYVENVAVYDWIWGVVAVSMIILGSFLTLQTREDRYDAFARNGRHDHALLLVWNPHKSIREAT